MKKLKSSALANHEISKLECKGIVGGEEGQRCCITCSCSCPLPTMANTMNKTKMDDRLFIMYARIGGKLIEPLD